jgi:hypothetical protein
LFEFKPYIGALAIEGCSLRFFYDTPQAAEWYDPLQPHQSPSRGRIFLLCGIAACDSTIMVETSGIGVMPAPMSLDLRLRIVGAVERGRFAVSPSAAIKARQRVRAMGSAAPARTR